MELNKTELEQNIEENGTEKTSDSAAFAMSGISNEEIEALKEMMGVGLMYGHKKSKTDPRFRKFIHTTRNGMEIIDVSETSKHLDSAIEVFKNIVKNGGVVLFVATQPSLKEVAEKFCGKFNFSYINERWIGGLLTNFKVLSKRIEYFKKMRDDFEKGLFEKYTKKERLEINKNIERMRRMFSGVENLSRLPDLLFIVDSSLKNHATAIREAKRLKIKVMGIIDSDDNPDLIDYLIPANDHAKMSVEWIINKITDGLQSTDYGKKEVSDGDSQ